MTPITHPSNRGDWQMLPDRTDDPADDACCGLAGNARWNTRSWRDDQVRRDGRIAIAINHLRVRSPHAFELDQALISHPDIAKVIAAKTLSTGLLNCLPVQHI